MGDMPTTQRFAPPPLAAVACLGVTLAYFDRAVPAAAAPLLKQALAVSDARLGFAIATAAALGYAGVAILLAGSGAGGRRLDRLMIVGAAAWTIGMAALAFANSFASYVAAEVLVGAGQALYVPAAVTVIAGGEARALGRSTARFTIASSVGRTSATLISGAILAVVIAGAVTLPGLPQSWRVVFLITALPNSVLIAALALRERPGVPAESVAAPKLHERMAADVMLQRAGMFLVATAPVLLIQAVSGWYPMLLVRIAALSPADAAMAAGAAMLFAAPTGQWIGGRLLDWRPTWRQRSIGVIAAMLALAGAVLAASARAATLASALAALVIVDLALGVAAVVALTSIQTLASGAERHRVNSLFFALVTMAGVGAGPLLAGRLSDLRGEDGAALAMALVEVAAIALIAALAGHVLTRAGRRIPMMAAPPATDRRRAGGRS
jgi:MFS family permease